MAQPQAANTVYLTRLSLKNIRAFEDFTLSFANAEGEPRMRTLIIGRNGTNKTTLLQSIVLGLVDGPDAQSLMSLPNGTHVAKGYDMAGIDVQVVAHHLITGIGASFKRRLRLVSKSVLSREEVIDHSWDFDPSASDPSILKARLPRVFITAHGTSRSITGHDFNRPYREYDSVQTLFRHDARLIGTELTLRRMKDLNLYEQAVSKIKRVLGLPDETEIYLPQGGGVEVDGSDIGKAIPLEGWADGYRLTFQWIIDLYAWAMHAGQVTEDAGIRGILLIDEIEQHLHPSLQVGLLDKLSELFPELQIIATTHSPMVALSVRPEELVVLKRERENVVAVEKVPDFRHYSIEDMIHDDLLFDSPVYSQELEKAREEYRQLAQKPPESRSPSEEEKLAALAREITPPPPEEAEDILQELRKMREEIEK